MRRPFPAEKSLSSAPASPTSFWASFLAFALSFSIAAGCSSGGSSRAADPAGSGRAATPAPAASDADEAGSVNVARLPDPKPARIVWEDFHRRGSRITLVSPGFDRAGEKLETGRLEPATKVVEPEILSELQVFMKSEGFFERATQVDPRSAVAVDAGLKAAITLETEGKRLSIFHVLGSGETSGGQAAVDSFVTIKKAILAVYNATTQYTGIVERH